MNRNKLKLLVIGLGSMGKRRIRNLIANGVKKDNIFGFNISKERCKTIGEEYGIKTSDDFKLAVKSFSPDVFMISTPPDTHDKYFLYAIKHKKHFFVEHPTTDKGYNKLLTKTPKGIVGVPSNSWKKELSEKFLLFSITWASISLIGIHGRTSGMSIFPRKKPALAGKCLPLNWVGLLLRLI